MRLVSIFKRALGFCTCDDSESDCPQHGDDVQGMWPGMWSKALLAEREERDREREYALERAQRMTAAVGRDREPASAPNVRARRCDFRDGCDLDWSHCANCVHNSQAPNASGGVIDQPVGVVPPDVSGSIGGYAPNAGGRVEDLLYAPGGHVAVMLRQRGVIYVRAPNAAAWMREDQMSAFQLEELLSTWERYGISRNEWENARYAPNAPELTPELTPEQAAAMMEANQAKALAGVKADKEAAAEEKARQEEQVQADLAELAEADAAAGEAYELLTDDRG